MFGCFCLVGCSDIPLGNTAYEISHGSRISRLFVLLGSADKEGVLVAVFVVADDFLVVGAKVILVSVELLHGKLVGLVVPVVKGDCLHLSFL